METTLNIVSIIIIVFGILQIILFFKIWGMTNDIREIKNKYMNIDYTGIIQDIQEIKNKYMQKKSDNLYLPFQKNEVKIASKNSSSSNDENPTLPIITQRKRKRIKIKIEDIDTENEDLKKSINKWIVLKKRGFTQQAIKECIEQTSLSEEDADKFISNL